MLPELYLPYVPTYTRGASGFWSFCALFFCRCALRRCCCFVLFHIPAQPQAMRGRTEQKKISRCVFGHKLLCYFDVFGAERLRKCKCYGSPATVLLVPVFRTGPTGSPSSSVLWYCV